MAARAAQRCGARGRRRAGRAALATWSLLALLGLLCRSASCRGFVAAAASGGHRRARVDRGAADKPEPDVPKPSASEDSKPEPDAPKRSASEDLFRASARRQKRLGKVINEQEKKEDAAVEALKKAMTTRDLEELDAAVKQADEVGLKPSETQDARRIMVEEKGGGLMWINHVGRRSFEIEWEKGDTVADLKKVIFRLSKVPYGKQVLKSGGAQLGEDFQYIEEIAATGKDKVPDVWLFDERDREDILADEMEGEPYYSDDNDENLPAGLNSFGLFLVGFIPALYVVTQIFGVNPFEPEQNGKMVDLGELLGWTEPGKGIVDFASEGAAQVNEGRPLPPTKIPDAYIVENPKAYDYVNSPDRFPVQN